MSNVIHSQGRLLFNTLFSTLLQPYSLGGEIKTMPTHDSKKLFQ